MQLIRRGQNRAARLSSIGQLHLLFLGHQAHHPHHLLQHRQHLHLDGLFQHAAVQPGQPQQVLRDPGEPFRLSADVRHKLPGGGRVHVFRLQNGIRQQPDRCQRRFQFVGSVGDKAAAGIFRSLEPVRQTIELLADLGDLIMARDLGPVTVRALPHLADGGEELPDLPRQHPGEHHAQHQHRHADHCGKPQEIGLQPLQQRRLLRIVFIGIDRSDHLALIEHRRRGPAAECPILIGAGKDVAAQQRLNDLRVKGILPHGTAGLPGVVEDTAGLVRHQNPAHTRLLHHRHGLGHILLRQMVQVRERVYHHGDAALQRGLLGTEHQVLGHPQRVSIEQQQHRRDDEDVAQAEFDLQAAVHPVLSL